MVFGADALITIKKTSPTGLVFDCLVVIGSIREIEGC